MVPRITLSQMAKAFDCLAEEASILTFNEAPSAFCQVKFQKWFLESHSTKWLKPLAVWLRERPFSRSRRLPWPNCLGNPIFTFNEALSAKGLDPQEFG